MTNPSIHLPDWECPECAMHRVHAVIGENGGMQCANCGWFVPLVVIDLGEDEGEDFFCAVCGECAPGEDDWDTCDHETGVNCMWRADAPDWEDDDDYGYGEDGYFMGFDEDVDSL